MSDNHRLETVKKSDLASFGTFGPVMVLVFHREPDVGTIRTSAELGQAVSQRFPRGFVSLTIVEAGIHTLGAPARAEAERVSSETPRELIGTGTTIEATGFVGAALRAILMTLNALTRQRKAPARVFDSVESAAKWLSDLLSSRGEAVDYEDLVNAIALLRKK